MIENFDMESFAIGGLVAMAIVAAAIAILARTK